MKTRSLRIPLFFASVFFLLCCTAGVFFLTVAPARSRQADFDNLVTLDSRLAELQIVLYRSVLAPVDTPRSAIEPLLDVIEASLASFSRQAMSKRHPLFPSSGFTTLEAIKTEVVDGTRTLLWCACDDASLVSTSTSIATVRSSLETLMPVIQQSLNRWKILTFIVAGSIIIGTWFLGLLSVWVLSVSVSRSSRRVGRVLEALSSGDYSACEEEIHAQESELSENLCAFAKKLKTMSETIAVEVVSNRTIGLSLSESLDNTSSTFEVVDGFIDSIRGDVSVLEEQVSIVKKGLERITGGLDHLDDGIINQKTVVEGSLESVRGMITTIGSMADLAIRDEKVIHDLVESSAQSQEIFAATYQKIILIGDSVSRINGMAEIIENIAEQTSMLSLNAAIEAAHAGDAGKGFAVVAEEITKLAEASSESSREISSSISEIIEGITSMAKSSGLLDEAFTQMTVNIESVRQTFSGFSEGLRTSRSDTQGVLTTMNTLQEVSSDVTRDSALVSDGAGDIASSMSELDMLSSRVFDGITAMSLMLDGLKEVMTQFRTYADGIIASGNNLASHIPQLK